MRYIQSFYQYPVTFSSIKKTIAARSAKGEMKNIVEVTEEELKKLRAIEPFFVELERTKKIRVLNHIPTSYIPPAQLVNSAKEEADKAKSEVDRLKAENEAIKAQLAELLKQRDEASKSEDVSYESLDYKSLQSMAKNLGVENVNVKKAELIEAIKDASHK